jgi:Na+-driven multidrug efflux pump
MRQALRDGVLFLAAYVTLVWMLLLVIRWPLARLFNATGLAADVVGFFCLISGPSWFFIGLLFLANASFNNLGFPLLSTLFNWGRATLGTIPFALLGARLGPEGAFVGWGLGASFFGIAAIWVAFWTIGELKRGAA